MNDMYYDEYLSGYSHSPYSLNNHRNSYSDEYSSTTNNNRLDSFFSPIEGFSKGNMQTNIYKPYKLTNSQVPNTYNERQRLLLEVQKYEFAMWDLNLYLNTHPMDRNAMMLFDQYRNSYKKAKSDYESKYGGLCLENVETNAGYWPWNKSVWPWEGE